MGAIVDAVAAAFRDYVIDGIPASGVHEPEKSAIRAIGPIIETSISNMGLGALLDVAYTTRAGLEADLLHDAGAVALVYADATDANNDLYVKVGATGAGSWTLTTALHDIVAGLVIDLEGQINDEVAAREAAIDAETSARTTAISNEATTRADADAALDGRLDTAEATITNHTTEIADEVTARTEADTALDGRLDVAESTLLQSQLRPGDASQRFTATLTGEATAGAAVPGVAVVNDDGTIRRITGAAVLGTRERVAIETGRSYVVRWALRRSTDPADPNGDAVRIGVQWLNKNRAQISQSVIADVALTIADGRYTEAVTFTDDGDAAFSWPATARYMVPFVQTYGVDGVTDIEVVSWEDITDGGSGGTVPANNYELWLAAGNEGTLEDYLAFGENQLQALADEAEAHAEVAQSATLAYDLLVGTPLDPITGNNNGSNTAYAFVDPMEEDGYLTQLKVYAPNSGDIIIQRYTRDEGTGVNTKVGSSLTVANGGTGLRTITIPYGDFPVEAGDLLALHSAIAGRFTTTTGSIGTGNVYTGSSAGSTFTAASAASQTRLQAQFTIRSAYVTTDRVTDLSDSMPELVEQDILTIGKVTTPVAAKGATTNALRVYGTPMDRDRVCKRIRFWAANTGTIQISTWYRIDNKNYRYSTLDIVVGSTGLHDLNADQGDFAEFTVPEGFLIGWVNATVVTFETMPNRHGIYQTGVTASTEFTDADLAYDNSFNLSFELVADKPVDVLTRLKRAEAKAASAAARNLNVLPDVDIDCGYAGVTYYGQSNEQGHDAAIVLNAVASAVDFMLDPSVKATKPGILDDQHPWTGSLVPLLEDTLTGSNGNAAGDTGMRQFCDSLRARYPAMPPMIASSAARGGTDIGHLRPDSYWYQNFTGQIQAKFDAATAEGATYKEVFVHMGDGESDQAYLTTYRDAFDSLEYFVEQAGLDIMAITGQPKRPIFTFTTTPFAIKTSRGYSDAVLDLCDRRNDCFWTGHNIRYAHANDTHLSAAGQGHKAEDRAKACAQMLNRIPARRIKWLGAYCLNAGAATTVTIWVLAPTPAQISTALLGATTDKGFKIVDSSGTLTINSQPAAGAAVFDPDTGWWRTPITIGVNRAIVAGPGALVRYGLDFLNTGIATTSAMAGGNVFDTDPETVTINGTVYSLAMAAPHCVRHIAVT